MRALVFALALSMVFASQACAQSLIVVNQAGVSGSTIARMEAAAVQEVNGPVHQAYPDAALIDFTMTPDAQAWTVTLVAPANWASLMASPSSWAPGAGNTWGLSTANSVGFHYPSDPVHIFVEWLSTYGEHTFSHEVVEASVDPTALGPEVCDPREANDISLGTLDGVQVAAFVRPDGSVWQAPRASDRLIRAWYDLRPSRQHSRSRHCRASRARGLDKRGHVCHLRGY